MNILASYHWLKEYLTTDLSPEAFARELSLRSMSVETMHRLPEMYQHIVVGHVTEIKPHPNADKLQIAITDIGHKLVEVVCGGKNLEKNMRVVVALPGASVRWHGEGEPVVLKETAIRGVKSFGMICAPNELGFEKYPYKEGDIWNFGEISEAKPGTSFVDAFGLDDTVFDIEVTSNRADAMSMIGLAREGAAATGGEFWFEAPQVSEIPSDKTFPLQVSVKDRDACPRYMTVVMDGVKIGPSPAWMQRKLLLAGYRPINNIVDITNYILHEFGQPLHAFDYEKLAGHELVVRRANDGETMLALDDKEYELTHKQLVIADREKPVAIAGVMGGKESGTWEGTKTIVFEAASFDSVLVRRTSRTLNLFSNSQQLFEKGLSTESPAFALSRAIELASELAGGNVASEIIDQRKEPYVARVYPLRPQKVRDVLGVEIVNEEIERILGILGFRVEKHSDAYKVEVPFWRDHDIEGEIDLVEEVARIYGYHHLPSHMLALSPPAEPEDPVLFFEDRTKKLLAAAGYTECYSYSFVSAKLLQQYDIDPGSALSLQNPLSSEMTHMRPSLMPSLLANIERNQGEVPHARVFELQRVYIPVPGMLPEERTELVVAEFGMGDVEQSFLRLKGLVEMFATSVGLSVEFVRDMEDAHWHPTRSAAVCVNGKRRGMIGQIALPYQEAFGINKPVVAVQFDFESVAKDMRIARQYQPIPAFPAIHRDVAVLVDVHVPFHDLSRAVEKSSSMIRSVDLVEVYRGTGIPEGKKSVTLTIELRAPDRTLSSEHAEEVMNVVEGVLKKEFDGIIR